MILLHCANAKKAARRGLSEEHVGANLKACEETVKHFMAKHASASAAAAATSAAAAAASSASGTGGTGDGAVMQLMLGETPGSASDVRDRLIDFLDKTAWEHIRRHQDHQGQTRPNH